MRIFDCGAALIVGLGVLLMLRDTPDRPKVVYSDDWSYVVEQSNVGSRSCLNDFSFESPIAVQWGIHEEYLKSDIDNPLIFEAWGNGYKSFKESGVSDKSFSFRDSMVFVDLEFELYNATYDGEFIHLKGVVTPSGLTIQLGNDYELITDYYTAASVRECNVKIKPFTVSVTGDVDGLAQTLKSGKSISFNGRFTLSAQGLPESDKDSDSYVLDNNYKYIIRRVSDGLEVAYGCRN